MLLFISDSKMSCFDQKTTTKQKSEIICFRIIVWTLKPENFSVSITTSKDVIFLPDFLEIQETKH